MEKDIIEPGVTYHIFNRGNNQENIFLEEKNYAYFLNLVNRHLAPVSDIYAYCLLKNHFHLLLRIKDKEDLSEKFRNKPHLPFSHLFNSYTKGINSVYGRKGSLFQEHLKRKRVENEKYLIQLIAYIHLNPVKHGFVQEFKQYRYSSYYAYSTTTQSFLKKDFIYSFIEKNEWEYWHDEKKIATEYLLEFMGHCE